MRGLQKFLSGTGEFRGKYLRLYTQDDAKRVSALHESVHGVIGMLGSLDCMHVPWKNCPVALQVELNDHARHRNEVVAS